ncbi:MAG: hypothetical protein K5838_06860 [Elusimicrobiales bacterium]|nr:hypothetical protein [Elusimicrobiales bacterium]
MTGGNQYPYPYPPYPPYQPPKEKSFFSRLFFKIKITVSIISLWALCYSINSIMKNSIAIEYDGGLADSTKSWAAAQESGLKQGNSKFWEMLNASAEKDLAKPVPSLMCLAAKTMGIRVIVLCDRENYGGDILKNTWKRLPSEIYFTPEPNDKYILLEKEKPFFFAASSDEGLAQAMKAGIRPLRIKKAEQTKVPGTYTPGKFGEKLIPFSHLK